ncbi:MAG: DUF6953 family protein [Devosia sp.]
MSTGDEGLFTPTAVARWMVEQLEADRWLYQDKAAHVIHMTFGPWAVYLNRSGNYSIAKDVLKEFRRLTGDDIVWERGIKAWRVRRDVDAPGRQQE